MWFIKDKQSSHCPRFSCPRCLHGSQNRFTPALASSCWRSIVSEVRHHVSPFVRLPPPTESHEHLLPKGFQLKHRQAKANCEYMKLRQLSRGVVRRATPGENQSARGPLIKRKQRRGRYQERWVAVFSQIVLLKACGRQGGLTSAFGGLQSADSQSEVMMCMVCK